MQISSFTGSGFINALYFDPSNDIKFTYSLEFTHYLMMSNPKIGLRLMMKRSIYIENELF